MFPKWAPSTWANVRKLEEHLNPESGKMRIQPITLNQIAFDHFLSQSFQGVIPQLKA
jgi:acyl carrier protein phosphodiesterase